MPTGAVVLILLNVGVCSHESSSRGLLGLGVGLCDCVYPGDEHCLHLLYLFFSSLPRGSQPLPAWPCKHLEVCVRACVHACVYLHTLVYVRHYCTYEGVLYSQC